MTRGGAEDGGGGGGVHGDGGGRGSGGRAGNEDDNPLVELAEMRRVIERQSKQMQEMQRLIMANATAGGGGSGNRGGGWGEYGVAQHANFGPIAVAVAVATAVMAGENSALRSLPTLGLAVVVVAAVATAVVAGENMALRSMPTLGLATEALLNRLAHRRGFGLAEARSEIMRRRTNMQSLSQRLQKTKGVDVCGLKRCGRFRGGRSSRGYESPVCHTSSRCRLSAT